MKNSPKFDVAVIGAGPAGLMAAYRASLRGLSVAIYDPNDSQGRKLRITGKGRCNVCNNCDVNTVLANIPGDGRFLYSALNRFGPQDVIRFFENNAVKLKTERGMRVFPESNNAHDIANCLVNLCKNNGCVFFKKYINSLNEINANSIIIATGGCSYPATGSRGKGYDFARVIGHHVISPKPSLIPLVSDDMSCINLQGFAPKNVILRAYENNKLIYKELGEMLFTHFGISGPLVLSASAHMRDFENSKYRVEIDFKPALDESRLDSKLVSVFNEQHNKDIKNVLPSIIGSSMSNEIIRLANINPNCMCNSISKTDRHNIIRLIKSFPINIINTRSIDEAIITAGGVDVKEVDPRTMQSKFDPRIYFAGEILNLDAYTGGFNLQIAWSTGYVAGEEVL